MITGTKIKKENIVIWFLLYIMLMLLTGKVFAQDSASSKVLTSGLTYSGFSLKMVSETFQIDSRVAAIHHASVSQLGGSVAMVRASEKSVFKSFVGLSYSAASSPFSIDVLEAGVSKSLYLLRMNHTSFHTFEPYIIAELSGQRSSFFGNFLDSDKPRNYSTSKEPLLGRVSFVKAGIGAGVEYQLASLDNKFLHFFAEVRYGASFFYHTTNPVFSQTRALNPVAFSLGVSFGNIKGN